MLGVLRFEVADDDRDFLPAAREALAVLAARPGFRSGQLARAYDQPTLWCLVTEWESVGAYRRALGSFEVRSVATPLLSRALPEPSAYEPLATVGAGETAEAGHSVEAGQSVAAGRSVEAGGPADVRTRASDRAGLGRMLGDERATAGPAAAPAPTTDTDTITAWGRDGGTSRER
ncbi:MAG: antibiotic biosynthesis monooxygenase [Micromonosporaceae bacterium]|nr:antibiotic biosynthesis monooxygenase [Micromonosporaceae bacterium]